MLPRLVCLLCATALTSACARAPSVAEVADGAPPLSTLSGVTLGMRARALTSQRPRAVAAPYQGFREAIGGYSVLYDVPGSFQEDQAPPPSARLASVTASERLPSPESTFHLWRKELTRLRAARHSEPRCFGVAAGTRSDSAAVWSAPGGVFVLSAHAIAPAGQDSARAWLQFDVAPSADRFRAIFRFTDDHECRLDIRVPAG